MSDDGVLSAHVFIGDHPKHGKFLTVRLRNRVSDEQLKDLRIAVRVPICLILAQKLDESDADVRSLGRGSMSETARSSEPNPSSSSSS